MGYYDRGRTQGKRPAAVRSAFMRAEEIDRERRLSGWNPYDGEEETEMPDEESDQMPQTFPSGAADRVPQPEMQPADGMTPYFMQPDFTQVLEEQKHIERELRKLQSMYPETAKIILPYIEEECDKMEYEGSAMYDEYPDPTTVYRLEQRIFEQVKDRLPEETWPEGEETRRGEREMEREDMRHEDWETEQEETRRPGWQNADVFSMQYRGRGERRPGRSWPNDLIRVLLLQEMHHRRCRHRGCRNAMPFR